MSLVVDAPLVVAALVSKDADGRWAEDQLASDELVAPHIMPAEVANVLRRSVLAGLVSSDAASLAHADLLDLRVSLFPYSPFATRIWELRDNVTAYDAWYIALAESLNADLATLDVRLSQAPGCRCSFQTPPRP